MTLVHTAKGPIFRVIFLACMWDRGWCGSRGRGKGDWQLVACVCVEEKSVLFYLFLGPLPIKSVAALMNYVELWKHEGILEFG